MPQRNKAKSPKPVLQVLGRNPFDAALESVQEIQTKPIPVSAKPAETATTSLGPQNVTLPPLAPGLLSLALKPAASILFKHYFSVQVLGEANVSWGPSVFVADVSLPLAGPLAKAAFSQCLPKAAPLHWLMSQQALQQPFWGPLLMGMGGRYDTPKEARRTLQSGKSVLVFARSSDTTAEQAIEACRQIARDNKVPLFPIAIRADDSKPHNALLRPPASKLLQKLFAPLEFPLPPCWTFTIGQPLSTTQSRPQ